MTYVVNENCIKCKYMDCVEVCPVDCFREGQNMLVINQDECIDCAACVTFCPVDAIINEQDPGGADWVQINRQYGDEWPSISKKGPPPADAKSWEGVTDKFEKHFSALPADR